jgi:DNA-binding HxlR family transcriptional regulator
VSIAALANQIISSNSRHVEIMSGGPEQTNGGISFGLTDREVQKLLQVSFENILALLTVLGQSKRLKVAILLLGGPMEFGTLLNQTNLKKSQLSSHLMRLREINLVDTPSHGIYALTDKGRSYLRRVSLILDEAGGLEASRQRVQAARSFLERNKNP